MNKAAKPIPDGYHTATPSITVKGAEEALKFYEKAFGATILEKCVGPDGKQIMHAEFKIGTSLIMINDEFPEMGCLSPTTLGGTTSSIFLYVEDADASYERAVKAGAQGIMPVNEAFWGDRHGVVLDPYGHKWSISTRVVDKTPEEIKKAMEEWQKQMACPAK